MAISVAIQTLTAAFSNGILLTAAIGTLLVYFNSHGSTILQDGRRLVLALFLFFAALWAQVEFVNLMITSSTGCQVALVFSTAADQLARVALVQFLLWSVGNSSKVTTERLILQGILVIRLVAGGILVGLTRPELTPVCVARTSLLPVGIVVSALDFVFMATLIIRGFGKSSVGGQSTLVSSQQEVNERRKALAITGAGFLLWTGTSVTMLLGIRGSLLTLRTTLPSIGLTILIILVAIFFESLLPQAEQLLTPEATSPFITNDIPTREVSADNRNPRTANAYNNNGTPYVVNPSNPTPDIISISRASRDPESREFNGGQPIVSQNPQEQTNYNRTPGYRGSSGVFPSGWSNTITTQVASTPEIRFTAEAKTRNITFPLAVQPKRSLFNWSSKPVPPTVRSLGISNPVMEGHQDSSEQPFARIQTIDLATAAENERVRREAALARSRLVASRPAPHPPRHDSQEALRKSISVKRKQISGQHIQAMPKIESSGTSALSADGINGVSTSASLSPGRDEVRRRSPRIINTFGSEKVLPRPFPENKLRGLPSNPRSTRIPMAKEQTVMYIKDIVYDNPATVKSIIAGATDTYSRRLELEGESSILVHNATLKSSASILHRPRPYRRDSETERSIYPSEASRRHVRSKSGPSIVGKSIFGAHPGSPTQLPPLPTPPTMAAGLTRLLPNNTKSMTFNEKIELLFPAPPGSVISSKRRSSVPSIPRLPSDFLADTPRSQSPTEINAYSRRVSNRNTVASFDSNASHLPDTQPKYLPIRASNNTLAPIGLHRSHTPVVELSHESAMSLASQRTYQTNVRSIADEVGESWIPGIDQNAFNDTGLSASTLQNSTITSAGFKQLTSANSNEFEGSIHSSVPVTDILKPDKDPSLLQTSPMKGRGYSQALNFHMPKLSDVLEKNMVGSDIQPENPQYSLFTFNNRGSFLLDPDQTFGDDQKPIVDVPTWHRRIGDQLPTFSERKFNTRARKMPPPTPLLLNSNGKAMAMVVRLAEPSPPVDYPEKAIAEIQAQLERFENPGRESIGSLLRHMPDGSNVSQDGASQISSNRLMLLQNLEMEMGIQENHWQQMQTSLDRNSMSTTMSKSPSTIQEGSMSQYSSPRSSRTLSRMISRRARVRSSMVRSNGEDSNSTTSTQSSDNSRASIWQQRLAEAQMEYLENAPALLSRKKSVNFLSVSKGSLGSLGSPTPPESEAGSESYFTESDSEVELDAFNSESAVETQLENKPSLWQLALSSPKAAAGHLWIPPYKGIESPPTPEPPARSLRVAQRPVFSALSVLTSSMWYKPSSSGKARPTIGLWRSTSAQERGIKQRPITQRPLRKSKRITFLPDIVESPKPLPFRRDTLGIFQFPWGETSDSADIQPFLDPAGDARLEARSRKLELEEYSSSFFDDYDEEELDFDSDDQSEIESDDDFDETTLWEIASLLKTTDIPSKQNILPMTREVAMEYDEGSEGESDDVIVGESFNLTHLPILPLAAASSKPEFRTERNLWADTTFGSIMPTHSIGLPQPSSTLWKRYVGISDNVRRSKAKISMKLPTLYTSELWAPNRSSTVSSMAVTNSMWTSPQPSPKSVDIVAAPLHLELLTSAVFVPSERPKLMWVQESKRISTQLTPLFSASNIRTSFRTTNANPAAEDVIKLPRSAMDAPMTILSKRLWYPTSNTKSSTGWILKSVEAVKLAQSSQLWVAMELSDVEKNSGLFQQKTKGTNSRTSSLLPDSINMIHTPRRVMIPLAELTSNELWNGPEKLEPEHHWISESSIRCESPSIYSDISSGESSPTSDTTSLKSSSTKASSFWGSITSKTWWDKKPSSMTLTPSPAETPKGFFKLPTLKPALASKPLESVRESRVSTSQDPWETMVTPTSSPVTVRNPLSLQSHKYMMSFKADWDEALAEAIAAGLAKTNRPVANAGDLEAALSTAIFLGRSSLQRPTASVADWDAALAEAMGINVTLLPQRKVTLWVLPSKEDYVASANPMWSISQKRQKRQSAPSYHNEQSPRTPAKPGVLKPCRLQVSTTTSLWRPTKKASLGRNWIVAGAPPANIQMTKRARMWAPAIVKEKEPKTFTIASSSSPDMFIHLKILPAKKVIGNRPAALSRLISTELFRPTTTNNQITHWLHTIKTSPIDVEPASLKPQLWAAQNTSQFKSLMFTVVPSSFPDMFAHITSAPVKKATVRQHSLPQLTTNEIFKSSSGTVQSTHWLHTSSKSTLSQTPLTWNAPSSKLEVSAQLWSPTSAVSTPSPLFSNPHTAPWIHTKREFTASNEIVSWQLWRPDYSIPQSPMNWICNANQKISRVEFRY